MNGTNRSKSLCDSTLRAMKPREGWGAQLSRWGKFNLVGAVGMAVQLGTLALINCVAPGHYMLATAAALEITLLHNFVWHINYTWRDRYPTLKAESAFRMGRTRAVAGQLLRFHLANGLVSMIGNLALTPVLVEGARLPVVAANAVAILCCSIVNFCLGDQWAFVPPLNVSASPMPPESPRRRRASVGQRDRKAADNSRGPAPASC